MHNQPMKVCILSCTSCTKTSDTRLFKEAITLNKSGYHIRIIGRMEANLARFEEIDGLQIFRVDTSLHINYRGKGLITRGVAYFWHRILRFLDRRGLNIGYIGYYVRSLGLIKKQRADIYHAHDLSTMPAGWLAKIFTRGKLVYDSHEVWLDRNRGRKRSRMNRWFVWSIERFLSHRANAILATSDSHAMLISKYYHVKPTVIYNASYRQNIEHTDLLREELNIPRSQKILLYVGYITYGRGLECLVQSLNYLNDEYCLVFVGYGDSAYISNLKELGNGANTDRIHFFGPVQFEQVIKYASSADVGLAPIEDCCLSYRYCFPNKILEYIASGIPIAASDLPDIKNVIDKYEIGVTFNPDSPEDIARAVKWIFDDNGRYEQIRRNVLTAAAFYTWENESQKLLNIYDKLSSKKLAKKNNLKK